MGITQLMHRSGAGPIELSLLFLLDITILLFVIIIYDHYLLSLLFLLFSLLDMNIFNIRHYRYI